jgi:hypothetical protein
MRRLSARSTAAVAVALAAGLAAGPAAAAGLAQPSPTSAPEPAAPVPGEQVCAITDPRLVELSGLVALDDGYAVVNDSTLSQDRVGIFFLDQSCQVVEQLGYPTPPRDPEDLAWDREQDILWVGDTGDNAAGVTGEGEPRPSVAFWRIELSGDRTPLIHRFTYPDGQPRDAEALLLDGEGTPIVVSKSASGTAELFRPEQLSPSSGPEDTVPLEAVGEVTLPEPVTEVEHRLGSVARQVVTGATNAPDGSAVVLRSYTDAFEFDVTDGDVVAAVTTGEPRITPLPGEPLGEAITYSPDGQQFLTVSEVPEGDTGFVPAVLSFTPTAPAPPEPPAEPAPPGSGGGGGLFNDLQDIINVIAAVGVIGLLLVAAGVVGIVRARRAGPGGPATAGDGPAGGEGGGIGSPATGRARPPGGVMAAAPPPGHEPDQGAGQAGIYTSSAARAPAGPDYHGTEYGGGREYGGTAYPDPDAGYGADGYQGTEYGGAGYSGTEHGAAAGYPGDGYGGPDYRPADHPGPAGYQPESYDQEWHQGYPEQPDGRGDPGGQHAAGAPDDYYSDDPDYPYEFRPGSR